MTELLAMDALEPFGSMESTFMSAQICSIIVNSLKSMFSKSTEMLSPKDFMPNWEAAYADEDIPKPGAASDVESMKSVFKQLVESSKPKPKAKTKKRTVKV